MQYEILQFFECGHLDPELEEVSDKFQDLAHLMAECLPVGAETSVCLRKLLEAKDAAVRSKLTTERAVTREGA